MTGDVLPATHPVLSQLWREVLPAEQVLPAATTLAKRLVTENSVVSMALTKSLMWRGLDSPESTHLIDSQAIAACSSGDALEGVNSFMQKRPAAFKGTMKDLEAMSFYPWWPQRNVRQTIVRAPRHVKL
jgi:enoyl-CoA hydratase/carnithine racemase